MAIYLACHAMDPEGPDVFAQPLGDLLTAPRTRPSANGWRPGSRRRGRQRAPRDADGGAGGAAGDRGPRGGAAGGAAGGPRRGRGGRPGGHLGPRVSYNAKVSLDWLRKHQATCSRALYRSFDELRKLRRDFGDGGPEADEPLAADEIDPFRLQASAFRVPPEVVAPEASRRWARSRPWSSRPATATPPQT